MPLPLTKVTQSQIPRMAKPTSLLLLLERTQRAIWQTLGGEQNRRGDCVKRKVFGEASSLK